MTATTSARKVSRAKPKISANRSAGPDGAPRAARKSRTLPALPEIAAVLVDARRKDIDALQHAGRSSYEGVRKLVRRQVEQLKAALGEWQAVIKLMNHAGPRESVAQLDELGKGALQQAMQGIRELADMALDSQAQAVTIVRRRIDEDLHEIGKLLGDPTPAQGRRRR